MPPVILTSPAVDLTKIKMKWKEQYVSEGLNRKVIPSMPKGIYSGLKLVQNLGAPTDRRVEISAGTDGVHAAVYQSATGFSTTYFDNAGTSIILDLASQPSLDNQESVITLSIVYTIGADTTANWVVYPIADWNALTDAQRAERIVLGTVNVPAAATNITTAMITPNRRTVAWESESPGVVPWSALLKNPSFEHGNTAELVRFAISDWDKGTVHINGDFRLGTATVRSGLKSLEFNKTNVAAGLDAMVQYLEVPVVPGQLVKVVFWIRQLIAPTSGDIFVSLGWGDLDSINTTTTDVSGVVLASTDVSFRKVEKIVEVPAGSAILKAVGLAATIATGSTGVAFVIDDFQVYLEPGGPQAIQGAVNARLRQQLTSSLIFEEGDTYQVGQLSALMRFIKSAPASEGSLRVERRDQVAGSLPPALSLVGRIVDLGANLLGSEANALRPRITAGVSTTGGVDFTLMWESKPSGQVGYRKYVSAAGELVETINAVWGGSSWSKDVGGVAALKETMTIVAQPQKIVHVRDAANNAPWGDGAWDQDPFNFNFGAAPLFEIIASMNIFGNLWLSTGAHITLNGSGLYKRGTRVRVYDGLHAELISLYPGVYDRDKIDFFSGTSLLFWQEAGQEFRIPIHLEEGERLTEVRAYSYNGVTDTLAMRLHRQTITVGSSLAGTTAQVGATQTSTNHTNIIEQLTISGLAEDATAPGTVKSWAVELQSTAFASGSICAGIAVYTTIP